MASAASYTQDADGTKIIPATQRADGTWRKPRRVKDGYVPQEEIPLYESKGKQFASKRSDLPVGLTPEIVAAAQKQKKQHNNSAQVPGLVNIEKAKKKKKKKSGVEEITEKVSITTLNTNDNASVTNDVQSQVEPAKRLKNLKKKLRDIEILQEKIKSGDLKNPEREQLEKLAKKKEIIDEINMLEKLAIN